MQLVNNNLHHSIDPILATSPAGHVSERYQFVSTDAILTALEPAGWQVTQSKAVRVRKPERQGFQKHFIELRSPNRDMSLGDSELRVILTNSHDATSAVRLFFGIYRFVCANGLIVGNTFEGFSLPHSRRGLLDMAIDAAEKIAARAPELRELVVEMRTKQLTWDAQRQFATDAIAIRWPKGDHPVNPDELLAPWRTQDKKPDVWTVFNRIQENLVKGGVMRNGRRARGIASQERNLNVNRQLFDLAATYLKAA